MSEWFNSPWVAAAITGLFGVVLTAVNWWLARSGRAIDARKDLREEIKELWDRIDQQDDRIEKLTRERNDEAIRADLALREQQHLKAQLQVVIQSQVAIAQERDALKARAESAEARAAHAEKRAGELEARVVELEREVGALRAASAGATGSRE